MIATAGMAGCMGEANNSNANQGASAPANPNEKPGPKSQAEYQANIKPAPLSTRPDTKAAEPGSAETKGDTKAETKPEPK